jgi:hypothetical protein
LVTSGRTLWAKYNSKLSHSSFLGFLAVAYSTYNLNYHNHASDLESLHVVTRLGSLVYPIKAQLNSFYQRYQSNMESKTMKCIIELKTGKVTRYKNEVADQKVTTGFFDYICKAEWKRQKNQDDNRIVLIESTGV